MSPRPTAIVVSLFLGACIALVAVFAVLELDLVPRPSLPREKLEPRVEGRLDDIERHLRQVQDDLRSLAERLEEPVGSRQPPEGGLPTSSSTSEQVQALIDAVQDLRRELESIRSSTSAASVDPRALASQPGDLTPLLDRVSGRDQAGFDREASKKWMLEHHRFWTLPQLVEAYGRPDTLNAGDGGLWIQYKPEGAGCAFTFIVAEGVVYHAYCDCL